MLNVLTVLICVTLINVKGIDFENTYSMTKNFMLKGLSKLREFGKHIEPSGSYTDYTRKRETEVRNKTILLWSKPFIPFARKFNAKIKYCRIKNCVVHEKKGKVRNVKKYDAIIFSESNKHSKHLIPTSRSRKQKYIYLFTEPTTNYPISDLYGAYDDLFDWVMSYRLTSDIKIPDISIYDRAERAVVGPKINMSWRHHMNDISPTDQKKMKSKTKLGAIFIPNCETKSTRLNLVKRMNKHLSKYNLSIDVFGECGMKRCSQNESISCDAVLESDYFFYLSFENSFAVDYVTEKLTRAVHTHTVPVVLGGADYSRFLPPGSYINACDRDPAELAETLVRVMSNWTRYYEYFRFNNYYTYVNRDCDIRFVCDLCEMLNIPKKDHSRYETFEKWYSSDIGRKCQK